MKNKKRVVFCAGIIVLIVSFIVPRIKQVIVTNQFREKYKEAVCDTYYSYKNYISHESKENYDAFTLKFERLPELSNAMPESTVQNRHFNELNIMHSLLVENSGDIMTKRELIEDILCRLYKDIDDPNAYANMFVLRNQM